MNYVYPASARSRYFNRTVTLIEHSASLKVIQQRIQLGKNVSSVEIKSLHEQSSASLK